MSAGTSAIQTAMAILGRSLAVDSDRHHARDHLHAMGMMSYFELSSNCNVGIYCPASESNSLGM